MKKTTLLATLMVSSLFVNNSIDSYSRTTPDTNSLVHYGVHVISDTVLLIPAGVSAISGCLLGAALFSGSVNNNDPILGLCAVLTAAAGVAGGSYIFYQSPQITDRYVLGYEGERTTKQNIISLLSRVICASTPVGICLGEFLAHSKELA